MAGFSLFGLDATPFRIVIFATQFANLALVAAIGTRLTGRRAAGFWAAVFWVVNGALVEPLGWVCVYNQVMCAFFLLLAFYFLLRSVEADRGRGRTPRETLRDPSVDGLPGRLRSPGIERGLPGPGCRLYLPVRPPEIPPHAADVRRVGAVRPGPQPRGALSEDGRLRHALHRRHACASLGTYWTWSVGPIFQRTPFAVPPWLVPAGVAIVSLGLLAFLARQLAGRRLGGGLSVWAGT